MPNLPELNVGPAARHGSVTVLPIFATTVLPRADYALGTDAVPAGKLEICELPHGALVHQLQAKRAAIAACCSSKAITCSTPTRTAC